MIHEFRSQLPVETPLGRGYAVLVEMHANDNWWTVVLNDGAIVTFTQDRIRAQPSYTHRRIITDERMLELLNH